MLENYLVKGLVIGIVFGVPAGVVGVLSIQRVLTQGAFAGLMTGMGSSVADVLYAWVGVFGITVISIMLTANSVAGTAIESAETLTAVYDASRI